MILIVDDDPSYSEDLKAILNDTGYPDVRVAATGVEAINVVRGSPKPEAIVLDMMIPYDAEDQNGALPPLPQEEVRGVRVARELAQLGFELSRIIVITALAEESKLKPARDLGLTHILIKPVETIEIIRAIKEILSKPSSPTR